MKYVVAMFQHETNTFSSLKTPLEAFAKPAGFTDPPSGNEAISAYGKADFAFAAMLDAARDRGDEVASRICSAVSDGCDADGG